MSACGLLGSALVTPIADQMNHGKLKYDLAGKARIAEQAEVRLPIYQMEGFVRVNLDEISMMQICCTDEPWLAKRHSQTVSFRRQNF